MPDEMMPIRVDSTKMPASATTSAISRHVQSASLPSGFPSWITRLVQRPSMNPVGFSPSVRMPSSQTAIPPISTTTTVIAPSQAMTPIVPRESVASKR